MSKKTKKLPVFYAVLIALTVTGILITAVVLNVLWDFLSAYENALPKYEAQRVFDRYYSGEDFAELYQLYSGEMSKYEGRDQFEKCMRAVLSTGKPESYEVTTGAEDQMCFSLRCGKSKLATLYLRKSDETLGWGQYLWKLDRLVPEKLPTSSVKVKTLTGSTLLINGVEVGREGITETDIPTESCDHMPDGVDGITYTVYTVDGLIASPSITCLNSKGELVEPRYDNRTEFFTEEITYDEALRTQYSQLAVEALQTYQRYRANDTSRASLKKYFDTSSDFYNAIMHTTTAWFAAHTGHDYSDETVGEFYAYSDEVFSCRYVGTQIITMSRTNTKYFDIDCVIYFRLVGDEYKVYYMDFKSSNELDDN